MDNANYNIFQTLVLEGANNETNHTSGNGYTR